MCEYDPIASYFHVVGLAYNELDGVTRKRRSQLSLLWNVFGILFTIFVAVIVVILIIRKHADAIVTSPYRNTNDVFPVPDEWQLTTVER